MTKQLPYCISPLPDGAYFADVPLADGSTLREHFGTRKHKKPLEAALAWQLVNGISEWGMIAWQKICAGKIHEVKGRGVNLTMKKLKNRQGQITYSVYAVEWTNKTSDGVRGRKTQYFSPKKYGSLEIAEKEASVFCAMKRADRAGCSIDIQSLRKLFGLVYDDTTDTAI